MRSSTSSRQSSNGNFSDTVRAELLRLYGGCWLCGVLLYQGCHVFPKAEWMLERVLRQRGLLGFSLSGIENAISLCPNCHTAFDSLSDPGFVFVPSQLLFFIEFEISDYERRIRESQQGFQSSRICPSAREYCEYQKQNNLIPESSNGGLYQIIYLWNANELLATNNGVQFKSWHGEPMAAIRRGIQATGTMRVEKFPKDVLSDLRVLQSLYSRPDPQVQSPDIAVRLSPVMTMNNLPDSPITGITKDLSGCHSQDSSNFVPSFILGPQFTSHDAMSRYAPAFQTKTPKSEWTPHYNTSTMSEMASVSTHTPALSGPSNSHTRPITGV